MSGAIRQILHMTSRRGHGTIYLSLRTVSRTCTYAVQFRHAGPHALPLTIISRPEVQVFSHENSYVLGRGGTAGRSFIYDQ